MLVGRQGERQQIDQLVDAAGRGAGGVLVLRGEAGIGKTALLEHAASAARDMPIVRTRGIESESEVSFAGLLELLRPLLAHVDRLPERQAAALRGALGLEAADATDRFAVYAGTFGLLAAAAEERPLLALIDDAHWLDQASAEALSFASRRFRSERIAVLWAMREGEPTRVSTEGLRVLELGGLEADAALELVTRTAGDVAPGAARNLVEVASGNPLALLELPTMLTERQREGREPLEHPLSVTPSLQRAFGRRVEQLPQSTRVLLLLAAANDSADLTTIVGAADLLELDLSHLEPAEQAALITLGDGGFEFRHPLVRAAIYASADAVERRQAHRLLAEALVEPRTRARRAWHRALATVQPDESVAAELEATALRSQGLSWHAAARAYERAARLTPDDGARAGRLLAAARAWERAGGTDAGEQLLEEALCLTDDPSVLADSEHLLARILYAQGGAARAADLLERASARIVATDPEAAALILADAVEPWSAQANLERAESSARRAWELSSRGGVAELWVTLRYADVLGWLGEVERATELWLEAADVPPADDERRRVAIGEALFSAGQDERARVVLHDEIEHARASSSLGVLPYGLHVLSLVEARRGQLLAAATAAAEAYELAAALDQTGERLTAVRVLEWAEAVLGRERDRRRHVEEAVELRRRLGHETYVGAGRGMLELSLGHFDEAIRAFTAHAKEMGSRIEADAIAPRSFVPDLIEAYVRAGRGDEARDELEAHQAVAERSGRPSALARALRCRALLDVEEGIFEAALAEHERWENGFEHARTQLAFGEFLRRRKRRVEARVQLRAALAAFEDARAVIWAERAATELRATGERARRRDPSTLDDLTPQELQVVRFVATGLTNREVAERLFLSPKTIETHLAHVFRKIGVRTRTELAHKFRDSPDLIEAGAS